ncbi:hypothetical protein J6590_100417 [Homalodisca vitripennis]|nr:hypothetical protein J6590_100417 [Homalodisca vitripennis]
MGDIKFTHWKLYLRVETNFIRRFDGYIYWFKLQCIWTIDTVTLIDCAVDRLNRESSDISSSYRNGREQCVQIAKSLSGLINLHVVSLRVQFGEGQIFSPNCQDHDNLAWSVALAFPKQFTTSGKIVGTDLDLNRPSPRPQGMQYVKRSGYVDLPGKNESTSSYRPGESSLEDVIREDSIKSDTIGSETDGWKSQSKKRRNKSPRTNKSIRLRNNDNPNHKSILAENKKTSNPSFDVKPRPRLHLKFNTAKNIVIGENENSELTAGDKKAWVYKEFIDEAFVGSNPTVEKLDSKGTNASFKIVVEYNMKDYLFESTIWPKGAIVRRFIFRRMKSEAVR